MARGQSFTEVFTVAVAFAIAAIPTGLPGGRHDDPLARHAAARGRQRDHQAPALDRDARRDVGDLLGQDRHADAQPDDRGRADDPRPALHGLRAAATRPRARSSTSRGEPEVPLEQFMLPLALACDAVLTDDRRDDRRPDRGRARRAGGEGRPRPRHDARALPARRRAPVRHRLQADGDVPPDDRRVRAARSSAASSRARPTSCWRARRPTSTRRWQPAAGRRRLQGRATSPRTSGSPSRACA